MCPTKSPCGSRLQVAGMAWPLDESWRKSTASHSSARSYPCITRSSTAQGQEAGDHRVGRAAHLGGAFTVAGLSTVARPWLPKSLHENPNQSCRCCASAGCSPCFQ
jgi:hypothetical protein